MSDKPYTVIDLADLEEAGWPESLQDNYIEQLNATSDTEDSAADAKSTAEEAKRQVNSQQAAVNQAVADSGNALNTAQTNQTNLTDHVNSNSQHGVNGNNVGNEDFAQLNVGGVVQLAVLIEQITALPGQVEGDAPPEYSQEYAQLQTNAIRQNAELLTEIKTKFNALIESLQDSKQMQPNP